MCQHSGGACCEGVWVGCGCVSTQVGPAVGECGCVSTQVGLAVRECGWDLGVSALRWGLQ